MEKGKLIKIIGIIVVVLLVLYAQAGHINLPGHGNREQKNLQEAVVNYAASQLTNDETVEFGTKYNSNNYKENGEVRYSATVEYYVVAKDGSKVKHTAQVVTNEDKDKIIDWKEK
ncbi:MAG: hypothetical protein K6F78_10920 [Bacteroidaceae bacterium]|nr:hypothetical protein [Bacteroidaceae bacterium]